MSLPELKSLLQKYNQEHLVQYWDELSEEEQANLASDIKNLNLSEINNCFKQATSSTDQKNKLDEKVTPIPQHAIESIKDSTTCPPEKLSYYEKLGLEEIAKGKVAVILLAGGQGTRLGVDYPKGMYNVNLPSKRTLFHLQALRIKRLENLASEQYEENKGITWYIMTSPATHEDTVKYFESNDYFGLDKNKIRIFEQNTLPCFTFDGQIILEEKFRVSKAPDGNGGLYKALKSEGILKDMQSRGITSVHVYCVDNILVKVADPIFVGFCISRSADCGVKVVSKRSPNEPVGIVCKVDDYYTVVEYTEITNHTAELRNEKGELIFNAGNICNHYFTVDFLNELSEKYENQMELHVAKKKIPFVDENGKKCKPNEANGIKIEKFIFDSLKFSKKFVAWEVIREDEFSAIKNSDASGVDCPLTAKRDVLNLHKKWLLNAGAQEVNDDVEICPLLSYNGENLSEVAKSKILNGPLCLM